MIADVRKGDHLYKYAPYISIFVLAHGRNKMNKLIDDIGRDHVYQINTDGLICSAERCPEKQIGEGLGKLKKEAEGNLFIKHTNRWAIVNDNGDIIKKCGS